MTEVGHGLDISNLETTATLRPSGEFVLNTPSPAAAKYLSLTVNFPARSYKTYFQVYASDDPGRFAHHWRRVG